MPGRTCPAFHQAARLSGSLRHSFWSEIYEAVLACLSGAGDPRDAARPRKGKFNVTDKGGTLEEGYLDLSTVLPMVILTGLLLVGFSSGSSASSSPTAPPWNSAPIC